MQRLEYFHKKKNQLLRDQIDRLQEEVEELRKRDSKRGAQVARYKVKIQELKNNYQAELQQKLKTQEINLYQQFNLNLKLKNESLSTKLSEIETLTHSSQQLQTDNQRY